MLYWLVGDFQIGRRLTSVGVCAGNLDSLNIDRSLLLLFVGPSVSAEGNFPRNNILLDFGILDFKDRI